MAIGLAAATSVSAAPPSFGNLVVFGDSLSDIGNVMGGRYSNGPVWVEHLAGRFGIRLEPSGNGGTNFAHGGARIHEPQSPQSLRAQTDRFLDRPPAQEEIQRTLFVVYGGGNDLFAALNSPDHEAAVRAAAATAGSIVRDLVELGATDILVPNLPDVGRTPGVRQQGADAAAMGQALSLAFNQGLERELTDIENGGEVRIHRLDVFELLETVVQDPESVGFSNITEPCIRSDAGICAEPDRFLFWDHVHPTAAAHARLGEVAYRALLPESAQP